jgi:hypothetical protein
LISVALAVISAVDVASVVTIVGNDVAVVTDSSGLRGGGQRGGWSAVDWHGSECHRLDGADHHSKVPATDCVISCSCDMVAAVGDLGLDKGGWPSCGLDWGIVD